MSGFLGMEIGEREVQKGRLTYEQKETFECDEYIYYFGCDNGFIGMLNIYFKYFKYLF